MRLPLPFLNRHPFVPVIRLQGMIASAGRFGPALSDAAIGPVIDRAFTRGRPRAVALVVNSPGGSPVQSSLIAARIRRLAAEKSVPVHAFVEDAAASGGYWLATAADDIWVDESSLIGSIGVISAGFGFADLMARTGVERRVHTAGTAKSFHDPFRPERPEDVARLHAMLDPIHTSRDLFNGDIWVGQQAVAAGLADGIGHLVPKLRALYGDKVRLVPMGVRKPLLRRFGAGLMADALAVAEERAMWAGIGR
jgi:serine protease SohB